MRRPKADRRPGRLCAGRLHSDRLHTNSLYAVSYTVQVNGIPVGNLSNGGYIQHFQEAGDAMVTATTETTAMVPLEVEPGETYYIKGGVTVGIMMGRPVLTLIPPGMGEIEIIECKRVH